MTPQIQLPYHCSGYIFTGLCLDAISLSLYVTDSPRSAFVLTKLFPNYNSALRVDPSTEEQKPLSGQHKHPVHLARGNRWLRAWLLSLPAV